MLSLETNSTLIGRLRIRSKSSDPQAEQQRIGQLLRSAEIHPSSLPPSSFLVVRRMLDPLPAHLSASRFNRQADPAWQYAVASELNKLAISAARPALGEVPAESGAVLFHDRSEVLATLALDWMPGALQSNWWWRELFRGRDFLNALLMEWCKSPQYVPGALELLIARGRAISFLQRLPQPAAEEILQGLIKTFGLPRPNAIVEAGSGRKVQEGPDALREIEVPRVLVHRESRNMPAPWMPWVPEATTCALPPSQKLLLVQAMMLRRSPAIARSPKFQKEILRWWNQVEAENAGEWIKNPQLSDGENKASAVVAEGLTESNSSESLPHESLSGDESVELKMSELSLTKEKLAAVAGSVEKSDTVNESSFIDCIEAFFDGGPVPEEAVASAPRTVAPTNAKSKASGECAIDLETIETNFGGIFFLLNVALYLLIYGDFSQPEAPGLDLNLWDFVSLISHNLTGGEIKKDPLWNGLSRLAGRTEEQEPGYLFVVPQTWQLAEQWLEPFPEEFDRRVSEIKGRSVCVHPAGFMVTDMPIASATNEGSNAAHDLERWVGWMSGYIRARLVRALGREDAVSLFCRQPARVTLRVTHVDVSFSLNHHPIELRMAGLDRDPGWIPAAGRYVAYHFV
jgi:hypothetical protein